MLFGCSSRVRIQSGSPGGFVTDNRRATRHAVSIAATFTVNGVACECTILNVSLGGALVDAGTKYAMGQRAVIAFRVGTMEDLIMRMCRGPGA